MSLASQNKVTLSYRSETFSRLKPKNSEKISEAVSKGIIDVRLNTKLIEIGEDNITLASSVNDGDTVKIKNDLVYIFAGGELPTEFLMKAGIQITKNLVRLF